MYLLVHLVLFLFGTAVGSFLNVLIDRLPRQGKPLRVSRSPQEKPRRGKTLRVSSSTLRVKESAGFGNADVEECQGRQESIILGRSRCENCHTPLPWFDLIPIFSFLWLRGKCRFCGTKIPVRLLIVELVTGLGFALLVWFNTDLRGFTPLERGSLTGLIADSRGFYPLLLVACHLLLFSSFLVLFFTDLEYGVLPDRVVVSAVAVTAVWKIIERFKDFHGLTSLILNTKYLILNTLYWIFPAVCLSTFFLLLIALTRGRGMGFGDVKLGFLIGLVLGWPQTLVATFLAFLLGGIVSAILLATGKKHFGETIPFGPFLIVGTGIAALFGSQIWGWYLSLL